MSAKKGLRTATALLAAAGALAGAVAPAAAHGVTAETLGSHGWTCFVPPPRPDLIVCYSHGLGRPLATDPDPAPSYSLVAFSSASGEFLYTGHLVRADMYNDRPCAPGMERYTLLPLIGYYECIHI